MTEVDDIARAVFGGLRPSAFAQPLPEGLPHIPRGVMATVPVVLAGAMTVTMSVGLPATAAHAAPKRPALPEGRAALPSTDAASGATRFAGPLPAAYTVQAGDTVASIAEGYGLSTASLLALNGLGWKSNVFPGQVLRLSRTASTTAAPDQITDAANTRTYTVATGDTIARIASSLDLPAQAILDANGLRWTSLLYPGQSLLIPSATSTVTPPAAAPVLVSHPVQAAKKPKHAAAVPPSHAAKPAAQHTTTKSGSSSGGSSSGSSGGSSGSTTHDGYTYTVRSGDTVSGIADKLDVSTKAMLDANGLTADSVIHTGQVLDIPSSAKITALTSEMKANAKTIISVGRSLGVPDRGIVVALAAAAQESGLRNLDYGDRDSVGLFQQRPSAGWGTVSQLEDPVYASKLFYGGPSNPNKGKTRGLLDISGWQSMTITQAAQAVQISAYPNAYAKWEASAWAWLDQLG